MLPNSEGFNTRSVSDLGIKVDGRMDFPTICLSANVNARMEFIHLHMTYEQLRELHSKIDEHLTDLNVAEIAKQAARLKRATELTNRQPAPAVEPL